jgi:hypothetical protein
MMALAAWPKPSKKCKSNKQHLEGHSFRTQEKGEGSSTVRGRFFCRKTPPIQNPIVIVSYHPSSCSGHDCSGVPHRRCTPGYVIHVFSKQSSSTQHDTRRVCPLQAPPDPHHASSSPAPDSSPHRRTGSSHPRFAQRISRCPPADCRSIRPVLIVDQPGLRIIPFGEKAKGGWVNEPVCASSSPKGA